MPDVFIEHATRAYYGDEVAKVVREQAEAALAPWGNRYLAPEGGRYWESWSCIGD
jgi:hypothetical protein